MGVASGERHSDSEADLPLSSLFMQYVTIVCFAGLPWNHEFESSVLHYTYMFNMCTSDCVRRILLEEKKKKTRMFTFEMTAQHGEYEFCIHSIMEYLRKMENAGSYCTIKEWNLHHCV